MKTTKTYGWDLAAAAFLGVVFLPSCELLVQFDRNKIDGGETDVTMPQPQPDGTASPDVGDDGSDVSAEAAPDAQGSDTGIAEAGDAGEAGSDSAADADANANPDAPMDAPGDVARDQIAEASLEASSDSQVDATDGSADAADGSGDSASSDGGDAGD